MVEVAETDWPTWLPPLGMPLTWFDPLFGSFNPLPPCPACYQPSLRVVHLLPLEISVGVWLGFVKGKKINGSALLVEFCSLGFAWMKEKLGSHLWDNIVICSFPMLFTQTLRHCIDMGCFSLSETVFALIQVFTTYKRPLARYFSSYLKMKISCWTKSCFNG